MDSKVWTESRIRDVMSRHCVSEAFTCRLNGSDALGFRKDDIFIVAAGSIAGKRDERYRTVPFRWRWHLEDLRAIVDLEFVDDEKFTTAAIAAVVVTGRPADEFAWEPVRLR